MNIILLNGILLPAQGALISVDERGFRFGDGVFETIPVHNGKPYLLSYHLERLRAGLDALHITCDTTALPASITQLLSANKATDCIARLYVSRGIGSQGYLPTADTAPTILLQLLPLPQPLPEPVSLWLSKWEKISARALPVNSKLAQGVNATLARMEAREQGYYDALQQSTEGHISEASSANIFWIKDEVLYTPALSTGALAGVTRRKLMELSPYPVREGSFTLEELRNADAVFLTNAAYGIVPVHRLEPLGFTWENNGISASLQALRQRDIQAAF